MAELSIVGFALGSLSFILTLRNGIERVLQDADAYRAQPEILVPLSGKLALLSIHLESWQSFWNIYDGTPNDLFRSYWGNSGSGEVKKLLAHVYQQFGKVKEEFESKYGHIVHKPVSRDTPTKGTHSVEKDAEAHESLNRSFARQMGRSQRVNLALFTGSLFGKHLETLEKNVKLLQELSEGLFVKHVRAYELADWKDHVDYTAARSHLTILADRSSIASQALRDLVENSEDHNVDFHLDHGASPDHRQQQLFEFARENHIPYHLCVSPRHSPSAASGLRVQFQEADCSSLSNIVWNRSLLHALQKLDQGEHTSNGCCAYVKIAEDAPGFVVTRYHIPDHALENLRTFMISTRSDHGRRLQGNFSRKERTRLAYELAECALLFLRTDWFSRLCSCCIYRLESAGLNMVHTVRINRLTHTDHVDSELGEPCHHKQWCEQELLNMHIRRLGVLLTEIAIGEPIAEVAFNNAKNDVEIDFFATESEPNPTNAAHFHDILRRVRHESSEDFMDAVGYCLKQGTAPRDVIQADLESFYDHVVEPLLIRYKEEVIQPALRRQRRRHAREARPRG